MDFFLNTALLIIKNNILYTKHLYIQIETKIELHIACALWKWRNNRVVTILSTNTQPHDLAIVQCREHNGTRVNVQCPTEMVHYQDLYIYNFFPLFVAAIANSFILHTHTLLQ